MSPRALATTFLSLLAFGTLSGVANAQRNPGSVFYEENRPKRKVPDMTYDRISPAIISVASNATFVESFFTEDEDTCEDLLSNGAWVDFVSPSSSHGYAYRDANNESTLQSGGIIASNWTQPTAKRKNHNVFMQAHASSKDEEYWDTHKPVDFAAEATLKDNPTGAIRFLVKVAKY